MSCPDVAVMVGMAYFYFTVYVLLDFFTALFPRLVLWPPVGFPTTAYEDRSVGRNVFTCDSPSLPHVRKSPSLPHAIKT